MVKKRYRKTETQIDSRRIARSAETQIDRWTYGVKRGIDRQKHRWTTDVWQEGRHADRQMDIME